MTKVSLRRKPISRGRHTLYLDYYPPVPNPDTGKLTRREFLSLYIFDSPKEQLDKQHNKETLLLAEHIRAQRQLEVQAQQYGFLSKARQNTTLINYYKEQVNKRLGTNFSNWQSSLHFLQQFFSEGVKLSELTVTLCNDYRDFLLLAKRKRSKSEKQRIARNTALSYYSNFKATLRQAFKEDLLRHDLSAQIQSIKPSETKREFLTLEELQALYATDCDLPVLKRAAIFSALTGLRFSDIQQLTWRQIQHSQAEGYYIQFRQQKTRGVEVLPISEEAVLVLQERGEPNSIVFKDLEYSASTNSLLRDWVKAAGITKHITFHCFRHTFATLQLSHGTDIYTVSKLLGHRELKTTQIYARVIDSSKREAANRITLKSGNQV